MAKGSAPREHPKVKVVRVSNEVFKEVQKHAEPLEDDFEDALRKMLGMPKREV